MTIDSKIQRRLDGVMGKTFIYRARTITVRGLIVETGANPTKSVVKINTDTHPVVTTLEGLEATLDELLPVAGEVRNDEVVAVEQASLTANANKMTSLEDVLIANIEKLKSDPKFLPQAKEINSQVNTIIKIAKVKIDVSREMRKMAAQ